MRRLLAYTGPVLFAAAMWAFAASEHLAAPLAWLRPDDGADYEPELFA